MKADIQTAGPLAHVTPFCVHKQIRPRSEFGAQLHIYICELHGAAKLQSR